MPSMSLFGGSAPEKTFVSAVASASCLRRRKRQNIIAPTIARTANPPIAEPTITPVGVFFSVFGFLVSVVLPVIDDPPQLRGTSFESVFARLVFARAKVWGLLV